MTRITKKISKEKPTIVMVGGFPPPVRGMPVINAAVRAEFEKIEILPIIIELTALNITRSLISRLGRLPKVFRGLVRFSQMHNLNGAVLYISISGGFGQFYEMLFIILARLRGMKIYLHHHSFTYLDSKSRITKTLCALSGHSCTHIVLSPNMGTRLQKEYAINSNIYPLSNTVFIRRFNSSIEVPHRTLKKLGFLSNISEEKGVFIFLSLLGLLNNEGLQVSGLLAGPFENDETEQRVKEHISLLPNVKYVGPKYGAEKDSFWDSIDAFIFPTKYKNEAEPLVIYESMAAGVPVIAYGRGCIPEMLNSECGLVIDPLEQFEPFATEQIQKWLNSPFVYQAASKAAYLRFMSILKENKECWKYLMMDMIS